MTSILVYEYNSNDYQWRIHRWIPIINNTSSPIACRALVHTEANCLLPLSGPPQLLAAERHRVLHGGGGLLLRHLPLQLHHVRGGHGATGPHPAAEPAQRAAP